MQTYTILVEETLARHVEIEAESAEQAEEIATAQYNNQEIVLDADDFSDLTIKEINKE